MAAPMEVAVCTDSSAQLWSCVVWELHSGANLLTYRGGQAGPRGLALLNGEYLLAAQLGKNYISAWELQRKVRRRGHRLRWRGGGRGGGAALPRLLSVGAALNWMCVCRGWGPFRVLCACAGLGGLFSGGRRAPRGGWDPLRRTRRVEDREAWRG